MSDSEELFIRYEHCGHVWFDIYDCACDSECPGCGQPIEATSWVPINAAWNAVELTERL